MPRDPGHRGQQQAQGDDNADGLAPRVEGVVAGPRVASRVRVARHGVPAEERAVREEDGRRQQPDPHALHEAQDGGHHSDGQGDAGEGRAQGASRVPLRVGGRGGWSVGGRWTNISGLLANKQYTGHILGKKK